MNLFEKIQGLGIESLDQLMSNIPVDLNTIEEWTEDTWNFIFRFLNDEKNKENLLKKQKEKPKIKKVSNLVNNKT